MNFLNDQSLIFQLTHHILVLIPIPSINLFFQLTHQFNQISSPTPMIQSIFLADISVQPDLNPNPINQGPADVSNDNSIGTRSNNLPLRESTLYYKTVRRKNVQGHKSKNQKEIPKNTLFCHRVKIHRAKCVLPTFPVMIET